MPTPPEASASPREVIPTIELSPERVGVALNLEADEVREQLRSVEGRKRLLEDLQSDPQRLASVISPDSLKTFERDMEITQEDLQAEQRFLEAQRDPEKKGMFRRAWDTITGFPRKHPVITVVLLGVVLGVVASYMGWLPSINFGGLWGRAQGWLGWGGAAATGEAAGETDAGAAAEGAALGVEAVAGGVPEHLGIRIFEHSYLYGDKIYTMKELPQLLEQLPKIADGEAIRLLPYSNARVTAQIEILKALEEKGIKSWMLEKLADTEFIPAQP